MDNLGGAPLRKESVDFSINPLLGHYRKLLKIGQSVRFSLRALKNKPFRLFVDLRP